MGGGGCGQGWSCLDGHEAEGSEAPLEGLGTHVVSVRDELIANKRVSVQKHAAERRRLEAGEGRSEGRRRGWRGGGAASSSTRAGAWGLGGHLASPGPRPPLASSDPRLPHFPPRYSALTAPLDQVLASCTPLAPHPTLSPRLSAPPIPTACTQPTAALVDPRPLPRVATTMGQLSPAAYDALLLEKVKLLLQAAMQNPRRRGPPSTYEAFVEGLDIRDDSSLRAFEVLLYVSRPLTCCSFPRRVSETENSRALLGTLRRKRRRVALARSAAPTSDLSRPPLHPGATLRRRRAGAVSRHRPTRPAPCPSTCATGPRVAWVASSSPTRTAARPSRTRTPRSAP